MTKEEFISFVENALEEAIQCAEKAAACSLPRKIAFCWMNDWPRRNEATIREGISEAIASRVFQDEQHIWPCVDIGVGDLLPDGTLLIVANIAGYEPCPFQRNWTGREGPFVYIVSQSLLNRLAGQTVDATKSFGFFVSGMPKQC